MGPGEGALPKEGQLCTIAAFVCSLIFKDKFSRNIFIVSGSHLHGALGGVVMIIYFKTYQ